MNANDIAILSLCALALCLAISSILDKLKIKRACNSALTWLDSAPIEYSNGVEHNGLDEGFVRGWQGHDEIVNQLCTALGLEYDDRLCARAEMNELPF